MRPSPKSLAVTLALALSFASGAAFAQKPADEPQVTGTGATYAVTFVDDALNALSQDTIIPRIVVRRNAARVTLIRPRASFVTEMLKSVEKL